LHKHPADAQALLYNVHSWAVEARFVGEGGSRQFSNSWGIRTEPCERSGAIAAKPGLGFDQLPKQRHYGP
jgi:hypothetical protein